MLYFLTRADSAQTVRPESTFVGFELGDVHA